MKHEHQEMPPFWRSRAGLALSGSTGRQVVERNTTPSSRWHSPLGIFMLTAGALGVYYLLTEHITHVGQALPYLVLLACPLMHLFGHGGHGGHSEPRPSAPA